MAKKRKPVLPQTLLRGKKVRSSQTVVENNNSDVLSQKKITVELLPNNIGSVKKTVKAKKEIAKMPIHRINTQTTDKINNIDTAPKKNKKITFNVVQAPKKPKAMKKHQFQWLFPVRKMR